MTCVSPTSSRLAQVAASGTAPARLACRLLRAYEPTCACQLAESRPTTAARLALANQPAAALPATRLAAYPNPATTTLHVPYTLPAGTEAAELRLYDGQGRLVRQLDLTAGPGEVSVDLHGWAAGLYQLVLTAGSHVLGTQRVAFTAQP